MSEEERKNIQDLLGEFREFRGEMRQFVKDLNVRCGAHGQMIDSQNARINSLEDSREYAKGWLKATAIGLPAVGSISWFMLELGNFLKKAKGG